MNRFVFVLVLLVVATIGLGFYRGWFHLGSDNADGKSNVTLSMDGKKIQEDSKKAVANVKDLGHHIVDKGTGSSDKSMDGTVVSCNGDKLTMTSKDGKEHSHALAANAQVSCDGKSCKATDLKPGMRVRVTTENAEPHAAIRLEALDINRDFEKGI